MVGGTLKAGDVQKVLQSLLEERVSVRDMETILETLGDWGRRTQDLEILTEYVRNALARSICGQYKDDEGRLRCVTLDPDLEEVINRHIERGENGSFLTLPPGIAAEISKAVADELKKVTQLAGAPVVLCSPQVRLSVRRLLLNKVPNVVALAYNEIVDGVKIESVGMATIASPSAV